MDATQIGNMIRFHRKKSGLSQEGLAKLAGLGKTVVFDAEKGKQTIQLSTLLQLLKVLNITLSFQSPLMKNFEDHLNEKS